MKAIQLQSYGGPEMLQLTPLSDPKPGSGEVLVRIKASAVNPLDSVVRNGFFPSAKKPPLVLGEEAAGLVEKDGGKFEAGERVIVYEAGLGVLRDGTWAERVVVPASAVRRLPEGLSFEEGAAIASAGVTAYGALRAAELKPGETVAVLGSTGGVGSAAIQISKAMGARVIAVVSSQKKVSTIQPLGADHILPLSAGPLSEQIQELTGGKGAQVIIDPVGGEITGKALSAIAQFGRLVHLGYSGGIMLTLQSWDLIAKSSRILGFNVFLETAERFARDFDEVVSLADQKKYRALIGKTLPLDQAAEASRWLEERKVDGKVILTTEPLAHLS